MLPLSQVNKYVGLVVVLVSLGFGLGWQAQRTKVAEARQQLDTFRAAHYKELTNAQYEALQITAQRNDLSRQLQQQTDEDAALVSRLKDELDASSVELDDAYERLRLAARASTCPAKRAGSGEDTDPAGVGQSESDQAPGVVSADVLGGLGEALVELSRYADSLKIAGESCERFADRATLIMTEAERNAPRLGVGQ